MIPLASIYCAQETITTCLDAGINSSSIACPTGMMLKPNAGNISVTPGSRSTTAVCCVSAASGDALGGQGLPSFLLHALSLL